MAAIDSKYHIKIGDFGFVLAKMPRANKHFYTREEAPHFVNKFSSGEPNYRDSTFFPHWVQLNWMNGFNQEYFDDGGKFYRSSGVDVTEALQLTLQQAFNSVGQLTAGANITAQADLKIAATSSLLSDADLVSYYELEGNSTDYKAAHNGADTAITYSTANGKFNQGAGFNGSSSAIDTGIGNTDVTPGARTISMWVKPTALPASGGSVQLLILGKNLWGLRLDNNAGTQAIVVRHPNSAGDESKSIIHNTTLTTGTWYHLAAVWNGTDLLSLYINGVSVATNTPTSIYTGGTGATRIGMGYGGGAFFNGAIDDVAIFKRALTANEISAYYNANNPMSYVADATNTKLIGTSTGKIYSWDGALTLTELFDTRRLEWFESGTDADKVIGDTGGTETAQSQGFQVDAACKMKAVQVYLKKAAGTPGDITCRIETDSTNKPSGTLVDANATATIPAFTTGTYGWITVEFPAAFSLAATTTYHVVLKTAATANDNNYVWAADASSPGYSGGAMSASTDRGSTWSAVATADAYFRILGNATSVNVIWGSALGGSTKAYIGTGDPAATTNGDARLYSYAGSTFTLVKIFNTTDESSINCITEYGSTTTKAYIGLGHKAKVYSTEDWSTFTLAKTITVPNNPGYVLTMTEYNKILYIGGGFPEQLPGNSYQYSGFLVSYDEYTWQNVGDFSHTVVTALDTFDNLMFIGTIRKRLYVFNTSSIDKLFEFPWDLKITAIKKWDDMLAIATAPTPGESLTGGEGIYLFDRNGLHNAFTVTSRSWHSLGVSNNNLVAGNDDGYIYQTSPNSYQATGYLQTSYDEAQLPSIDKIRRDITLMFDSLLTGCSIKAEYKTDESDAAWTTLGTITTVGSKEVTYNFANGTYSKKISFKITLATTTNTNTPKLKKIIHKYVLSPDFGYLWKMKLLCSDDLIWLDGTEPQAILGANVSAGATSITLKSTDVAIPTAGFPDPNGSTAYATIFKDDGTADIFSYTGKTNTTLTGIPSTGTYALTAHSIGEIVKITGGNLHQVILDLKQSRNLFTFTDIDGLTHTVLFNSYQEDNFVINTEDYYGGLENEVPITLLEA